jgi:hypothetical protein
MDGCSALRVAGYSFDADYVIRHGYMHETIIPVKNMAIDAIADCG